MLEQHSYTDINAAIWDQWARDGIAWSIPVSHEVFQRAQAGQWDVILTASRPVPHSWFGELAGKRVLGLASGGGQQIPILCARGAVCTVLDYSQEQLARERLVAQREGYAVEIVRGDMTQPLPFVDESFDLVFHPVSNCYVEDVQHVWDECFRVLRPGGRLLAGMDNGLNFLFDLAPDRLQSPALQPPAGQPRGAGAHGGPGGGRPVFPQLGGAAGRPAESGFPPAGFVRGPGPGGQRPAAGLRAPVHRHPGGKARSPWAGDGEMSKRPARTISKTP